MSNSEILKQIDALVKNNDVVLFMKGEKDMPSCGFSAHVVSILNHLGVNFEAINVLSDDKIRNAIKEYSDWPTLPQLYIKGEFVGGCDIVSQMFEDKSLQKMLGLDADK